MSGGNIRGVSYLSLPDAEDGTRTFDSAYDALMHEVCVERGFCGRVVDDVPRHVDHFIPETGPVSADQFIDWLFQAEGMSPGDGASFRPALEQAFVRHMGASIVDATELQWAL